MRGFGFVARFLQALSTDREHATYLLVDEMLEHVYPKLTYTEHGRIWQDDAEFQKYYERFENHNYHSADRKWMLKELTKLVEHVPGDTAEVGVYKGATAWLICDRLRGDRTFFGFDSFEGLSTPAPVDGICWQAGELSAGEEYAELVLAGYPHKLLKGWVPDRFHEVADRTFCLVHIDVDLYQPTFDALSFFYPRMNPGGIVVVDDYGFTKCPGAKEAFDQVAADKPEPLIHCPTGQAFLIKR